MIIKEMDDLNIRKDIYTVHKNLYRELWVILVP